MRLSISKINHIAHLITNELVSDKAVRCLRDKNDIRLRVKIIITDELKLENEIDRAVRQTLSSLSKSPPEGSKEWEVLYEKYYEDQMARNQNFRFDGIRRMT